MNIHFYEIGSRKNSELLFAVIVARYQDKWIFVRHRDRDSWEVPGGRREPEEDINDTAARELTEETGARSFEVVPVCIYSVEREGVESFGQLFFAEVKELGELRDSEIDQIMLSESMPGHLTYPWIQPHLYNQVIEFLA